MLPEISAYFREKLKVFFLTDNLILNNKVIPIDDTHFKAIADSYEQKNIAFIDGGQAEIFTGGSLSLSFIRVFAQVMKGKQRVSSRKEEFYVFTTAVYKEGEIWYEGKIFSDGEHFILEKDLCISSNDASIKSGLERGSITSVAGMARRLAELKMASIVEADYVLVDGTLEASSQIEENYIAALSGKVSALAKTCSLFTTCGNSPIVLLQKLSPLSGSWSYQVDEKNYFVKLNSKAKHVFRFQGNNKIMPFLVENSHDAVFLGYPYGLLLADQMARVSNAEKNSLRMKILLREENKEMVSYLQAMNAHEILDGK